MYLLSTCTYLHVAARVCEYSCVFVNILRIFVSVIVCVCVHEWGVVDMKEA